MSGHSQNDEAMRAAANRLHHLSMRYAGALVELLGDKPVGMIPRGQPGLREARDFIDLILFTRAEINALTKLLEITKAFAAEYEWFAQQKAKFLGVGLNDAGLVFRVGGDGASN
jgi:hypothetical protein